MTKRTQTILGLSCSPRAVWKSGSAPYAELANIDTQEDLAAHLKLAANAGKKQPSNSEIGLAAGLWAAKDRYGTQINHARVSDYFQPDEQGGAIPQELRERILSSQGLLVATPVYFGDRSSHAQSVVEAIGADEELRDHLRHNFYGGIAVGAKRNGGQETTLIYQMLDYMRLGLLGVGNDYETTSQYGGTGHAGDAGSIFDDDYGMRTIMGTGRRLGALLRKTDTDKRLVSPLRVLFVILQDSNDIAHPQIDQLVESHAGTIDAEVLDLTGTPIKRCLACDYCPNKVTSDDEYGCAVQGDPFEEFHSKLIHADVIIPVMVSTKERPAGLSNYQNFIERTRYIRRGDYALINRVIVPFAIEEPGYGQNYSIRLITSFIRHATVIHSPLKAYLMNGTTLNRTLLDEQFASVVEAGKLVATSRYAELGEADIVRYNPIGYILSANKVKENKRMQLRAAAVERRFSRLLKEAQERIR